MTPASSAQNYVVGYWYKTMAGFTSASGAGCTVTFGSSTRFSQFDPTGGEWTLATIGVPIAFFLQITLVNSAAQDVLLDSVYVVPLPGSMLARTYDAVTQNYTSGMDAAGRTRWAYYDAFLRPTIQVGPNGCPRATTQLAYGTNSGTSPSLPAGQYAQTTITTPLKATSLRVRDKLGQTVAAAQQDASGATTAISGGIRSYTQSSSGTQSSLSLNLPNALLSGPQSNCPAFVRTTVSDATGHAALALDPNAGQTQFLSDPSGRVRFVQPALNPGERWFLYNKYDALGRLSNKEPSHRNGILRPWRPMLRT